MFSFEEKPFEKFMSEEGGWCLFSPLDLCLIQAILTETLSEVS